MNHFLKLGLALGLSVMLGGAAQAAIAYSSNPAAGNYATSDDPNMFDAGGGLLTKIGSDNTFSGNFDRLLLTSGAGFITGDGIYLLNPFSFAVGFNRQSGAGPFHYSFTQDLTIGGVTHSITIPFTVQISSSDTLIFNASASVFYDLGIVTLTAQSLGAGPFVNDRTGNVMVKISGVPEPTSIALMLIALLSLAGFSVMRRQSQA